MQRLRATTAAGVLARAQVLAQHAGDFSFSFDYRSTKTGRLLDYLLRDAAALAGEQGEALPYVPPQSPDAKVIALCGEHDVLERQYQSVLAVRTVEQELEVEAEADAIQVALGPIVERIAADPPTTAEGWRAVAGSLVLSHPETIGSGSGCNDEILLSTLLSGLLGRA